MTSRIAQIVLLLGSLALVASQKIEWRHGSSVNVATVDPSGNERSDPTHLARAMLNFTEDGVLKQALVPGKYFASDDHMWLTYRKQRFDFDSSKIEILTHPKSAVSWVPNSALDAGLELVVAGYDPDTQQALSACRATPHQSYLIVGYYEQGKCIMEYYQQTIEVTDNFEVLAVNQYGKTIGASNGSL